MKRNIIIGAMIAFGTLVAIAIIILAVSLKNSQHIAISTKQGSVTTAKFTENAPYQYTGGSVLESTDEYAISYDATSQSFNIAISEQPIAKSRTDAEMKFLSDLGITQSEACKLTVTLGVNYGTDPNLFDRNFGLSFCPTGVPFPANE